MKRRFEPETDPEPMPWGWAILTVIATAAIVWLLIEIPELLEDIARWVERDSG